MIAKIIEYSIKNRFLVLLVAAILVGVGGWGAYHTRLDAIPDLSDVQVIVVTKYPSQNPQVVQDQVTYPLTTAMLSVPHAKSVRGFTMFEESFVYVIFDEGTDLYWARSRVLEYLNFARDRLPPNVQPKLGPDATGVGWVYQYALFPGYYSPDHPKGIWHDEEQGRWYAKRADAAEGRREKLIRVRGWDLPGNCPLSGKPLLPANQDLAQLRSLQDWYIRYPLTATPGVAEVAPVGGYVKQYQVVLDPQKLQAYKLAIKDVMMAVQRSNNDVGGSTVEMAENEYMVRSRAYVKGVEDLRKVVVAMGERGTPVLLGDVATVGVGGEMRRGIGDLDGEGEVAGGVVVARFGENAYKVIQDAKAKLFELEDGLPPGVFVKTTYDRSQLIHRSIGTLEHALAEELLIVALICIIFLFHFRSALVAIVVLPIGLLLSVLAMNLMGINANIMSLGGLALSIGVMIDSSIVMIENVHKHMEREKEKAERGEPAKTHLQLVIDASKEVGPSLFFSLLVIVVSFLPIFTLTDQSGRLFKPLAYTKTFAIAAGALLGVTLIPILMVYLIRGRVPHEEKNPVNRFSMALYEPFFRAVMRHPALTLLVVVFLGISTAYPLSRLGSEFMPPLDEGDLLYMPTVDPSISVTKSKEVLQQTNKLIKTFPEVVSVHGKIGRAESATDPAPMNMIETVVRLNPDHEKWRKRTVERFYAGWPKWAQWTFARTFWPSERRITTEELKFGWTDGDGTRHPGLNDAVSLPGVANAWPFPIENRINMLATGIKTPVGIKILGADLQTLSELAEKTASAMRTIPGTLSAYPERTFGGFYLDFDIDRVAIARYGLETGDVQDVIEAAIGGMNITTTVEGLQRYPVNLRYARELRDNVPALRQVLVPTPSGAQVPIGQLADIRITPGAPMIRSENGQPTAWIFVDIAGRDLGGYVAEAKRVAEEQVPMPAGYSRVWSGRFEYLEQANARLRVVIPITFAIIVLLLYVSNRSWFRVAVVLLAVPFSLIGAFWFLYLLDYNMSLAVWVGIIALLGVDAETGQVMLLYLDNTFERFVHDGRMRGPSDLIAAIHEGAVKRVRPKTMTVLAAMLGLFPMLWATGTGADVTRRLVAPLIGGIAVSFLMELLVYPVVFYLYKKWQFRGAWKTAVTSPIPQTGGGVRAGV
jgi:copper/silver efflux system protein